MPPVPSATAAEPAGTARRPAWRVLTEPPMLLLHLAGVLAVLATGWLGQWQVAAWQDSREDRAAESAEEPPVPLSDLLGPDDAFPSAGVGRPVRFAGQWLSEATAYVVPRVEPGGDASGAWQVVPVLTCGGTDPADSCDAAVPVVVGWVPDPAAAPAPPTGPVTVTGWLQPPESPDEPDRDPTDDQVPALRAADLLQRTGRDLWAGYVQLDTPAAARAAVAAVDPTALPGPGPWSGLRNLLYGIQWWVFSGFAIYLWVRWCRDAVAETRVAERRLTSGA